MDLEAFILEGKRNGWVGSARLGRKVSPSREGSSDIVYDEADYHYHDSFVGFSDFCGQEHVAHRGEPVWSMVYYGYLVDEKLLSGTRAAELLTVALSKMYEEGRFLGGFSFVDGEYEYRDMNFGDYKRFNGMEKIYVGGKLAYELAYTGGVVRK